MATFDFELNIKTINGESILGAGDVTIASLSVGTDGQIPFTNATGDDLDYSSGLTYSGTELYAEGDLRLQLNGQGSWDYTIQAVDSNTANIGGPNRINYTSSYSDFSGSVYIATGGTSKVVSIGNDGGLGARLGVKGRGTTTQATFLLQNSADTELFKVLDNGTITDINGNTFHSLGTDGQIPFTNATGDDLDYSSSFTYTDANKQLNLIAETSANITPLLLSQENTSNQMEFQITSRNHIKWVGSQGTIYLSGRGNGLFIGGASTDASARLHVKGSGTTSATTTFLLENSAGTNLLKVTDDGAMVSSNYITADGYKMGGFTIEPRSTVPTEQISFISTGGYTLFNVFAQSSTSASPKLAAFALWDTDPTFSSNINQFQLANNPTSSAATIFTQAYGSGTAKPIKMHANWSGGNYEHLIIETDGDIGMSTSPSARLHVKGSGTTSATTSLLVQNSAGTDLLKVTDDGAATFDWGTHIFGDGGSGLSKIAFRSDGFGSYISSNGYNITIRGRGASSGGVLIGGTSSQTDLTISQYRYVKFADVGTPSTLENGAMWYDGTNFNVRIGGTTYTLDKT